jgi:hypothetical protein
MSVFAAQVRPQFALNYLLRQSLRNPCVRANAFSAANLAKVPVRAAYTTSTMAAEGSKLKYVDVGSRILQG